MLTQVIFVHNPLCSHPVVSLAFYEVLSFIFTLKLFLPDHRREQMRKSNVSVDFSGIWIRIYVYCYERIPPGCTNACQSLNDESWCVCNLLICHL